MTLAGQARGTRIVTDNGSLATKLALRERTLAVAGLVDDVRVFDVCAGEGRIWDAMRRRVRVTRYLPVDKQPRLKGAFELEAIQALRAVDVSAFNAIDIDTYGDPWWIFFTLLPLIRTRTCVWLTYGTSMPSGALKSVALREAAGIPRTWDLPGNAEMIDYVVQFALAKSREYSIIENAWEAKAGSARYYGLVLAPKNTKE